MSDQKKQKLITPAGLGEVLGISEERALALRRSQGWPCVQISRKTIRFTPDQVEQIIARHTKDGEPQAEPTKGVAIPGQTKASRARRSA